MYYKKAGSISLSIYLPSWRGAKYKERRVSQIKTNKNTR